MKQIRKIESIIRIFIRRACNGERTCKYFQKISLDRSIKKKEEKEEKEVKECTFNPTLTENTKKIIQNKEECNKKNFYERSILWKTKNQKNRIHQNVKK